MNREEFDKTARSELFINTICFVKIKQRYLFLCLLKAVYY